MNIIENCKEKVMYVIMPIQRLMLHRVEKIGGAYLIPPFDNADFLLYSSKVDYYMRCKVKSIMNGFKVFEGNIIRAAFMMYETERVFDYENNDIKANEEIAYLLGYDANKYLNTIRLSFCNINKPEELPGRPGYYDGFYQCFVYDSGKDLYYHISGGIANIFYKGIGLYYDEIVDEYDWYFDNRNDETALACKKAINRVNEILYFENTNIKLIYILTTYESLASRCYVQFQKMKATLLPFIVENKNEYNELSEWFKEISDLRTELVHNGKDLFDLLSYQDIKFTLNKLIGYLINIIQEIYSTKVKTYEQLISKKKELYENLN